MTIINFESSHKAETVYNEHAASQKKQKKIMMKMAKPNFSENV